MHFGLQYFFASSQGPFQTTDKRRRHARHYAHTEDIAASIESREGCRYRRRITIKYIIDSLIIGDFKKLTRDDKARRYELATTSVFISFHQASFHVGG